MVSFLLWSLVGLLSGLIGCFLGGLVGSFWPQTVLAAAGTGLAFGLLMRRPRLVILAGAAAAVVSTAAFPLGARTFSPLLAWPLAGLAIGLAAVFTLRTRGRKIGALLSAPFLAGLGFAGGSALLAMLGMALNESQLVAHFMLGGAAGFGFLVLAGLRIVTWREIK